MRYLNGPHLSDGFNSTTAYPIGRKHRNSVARRSAMYKLRVDETLNRSVGGWTKSNTEKVLV